MEMNKKLHINMSVEDVKNAIVKYLYNSQGVSGIFDVKFKVEREFFKSVDPHDSDYRWIFDGADITVDLNEQ